MTPDRQIAGTPSFADPPVIETAMGVTFEALEELTNAHLGAYWVELGDSWPTVEDGRLVERQIEEFEATWVPAKQRIRLSQDPSSKLTIFNSDASRAIQLQQSSFDLSWIRNEGSPYPRYEPVKAEFDQEWGRFCAFAENRKLGPITQRQWEVTYVNKIAEGSLWETPDNWPEIFSTSFGIPWKSDLADLESFSTQWHFQISGRYDWLISDQGEVFIGRGSCPWEVEKRLLYCSASRRRYASGGD